MSETWEEAILRIVKAKSGVISLQELYREMEHHPVGYISSQGFMGGQPTIIIGSGLPWPSSGVAERVQRVGRGLYIAN